MSEQIVIVDVREDIRAGREPFSKIMAAVSTLRSGQQLRLLAPFEPVPLLRLLERQGFQYRTQTISGGDWEVLFTNGTADIPLTAGPAAETPNRVLPCSAPVSLAARIEVDARGLEPPQPLVRILEAVAVLPTGGQLCARTDRRPMHLYPRLEERGYTAQTQEESDGSFTTYIQAR